MELLYSEVSYCVTLNISIPYVETRVITHFLRTHMYKSDKGPCCFYLLAVLYFLIWYTGKGAQGSKGHLNCTNAMCWLYTCIKSQRRTRAT